MADPQDLSREIDRLWAKLGSAPAEPGFGASTGPIEAPGGAEVAWETVSLLKRQQRRQESTWEQALEAKENALKFFRERAAALEAEASQLRGRLEGDEDRVLAELLDAQERLQSAAKAMALQQARHDEERRVLQTLLDEARERQAAETARARALDERAQKREQQHHADMRDLQSLLERRDKEGAQADESVRALKGGLAEAKNALEKTLSEFLVERKERERVEAERGRALQKADEVQRHFDELQKLWEEERAQWRELWDRERSTWEAQRAELAQWEESLRREREAWHAELQEKEKTHLTFTESLTGRIRESVSATEGVTRAMRELENRDADSRAAAADAEARARGESSARTLLYRRAAGLAFAMILVAAGAGPSWRWARAWRYAPLSTAPVAAATPAALAYDGARLWIADWNGTLTAYDPADPRRATRALRPVVGSPYRPTSLAFGGGTLWSLDAAQARLLRHNAAEPEKVVAIRPSPGPAPTALAYDGQSLWSYDAANRSLYKHGGDESVYKSFAIAEEVVPNAMVWVGSRLWMHDAKTRTLRAYQEKDGGVVLVETQPAPDAGVLGLAVIGGAEGGRVLAVLAGATGARPQPALLQLKVRRRAGFTAF